jgi:transcriptional regulator with XRE-family HTH domain
LDYADKIAEGATMETILSFNDAKKITHDFDESLKGDALYKVIFGIMREWDLSQEELADLVGRNPTTISEWKKNETIAISKKMSMADYQLFEFIELYKTLTNLFVSIKDRVGWLRESNEGLENKSPLELIEKDPRNLQYIRDLVSRLANP